jgi:hypothetical protein
MRVSHPHLNAFTERYAENGSYKVSGCHILGRQANAHGAVSPGTGILSVQLNCVVNIFGSKFNKNRHFNFISQ